MLTAVPTDQALPAARGAGNPGRGKPLDLSRVRGNLEMIPPPILARVKQTDRSPGVGVNPTLAG